MPLSSSVTMGKCLLSLSLSVPIGLAGIEGVHGYEMPSRCLKFVFFFPVHGCVCSGEQGGELVRTGDSVGAEGLCVVQHCSGLQRGHSLLLTPKGCWRDSPRRGSSGRIGGGHGALYVCEDSKAACVSACGWETQSLWEGQGGWWSL